MFHAQRENDALHAYGLLHVALLPSDDDPEASATLHGASAELFARINTSPDGHDVGLRAEDHQALDAGVVTVPPLVKSGTGARALTVLHATTRDGLAFCTATSRH